jgi:hypothetical protein
MKHRDSNGKGSTNTTPEKSAEALRRNADRREAERVGKPIGFLSKILATIFRSKKRQARNNYPLF